MNEVERRRARIQQLCSLGLGGQAVMPAVLKELHGLIPSSANSFFWCDADGNFSNVYDENPGSAKGGDFDTSDLSDEALRNPGCHGPLRLVVRHNGRALGALQLWRSRGHPAFTAREMRRLAVLEPDIARALNQADDLTVPLVDSGESGLLIADHQGRLVHMSPHGRRLLFYCNHPRVAPDKRARRALVLPPAVIRLCKGLGEGFDRNPRARAATPHHRNAWGGFSFRLHWLESLDDGPRLIGIVIARREPLPVRLLERMAPLSLTRRQTQLCLMMVTGYSYKEIARRLGIVERTVITHAQQVYQRLDVHNRSEMVGKLLLL